MTASRSVLNTSSTDSRMNGVYRNDLVIQPSGKRSAAPSSGVYSLAVSRALERATGRRHARTASLEVQDGRIAESPIDTGYVAQSNDAGGLRHWTAEPVVVSCPFRRLAILTRLRPKCSARLHRDCPPGLR